MAGIAQGCGDIFGDAGGDPNAAGLAVAEKTTTIYVARLSGDELVFEMRERQQVTDLKCKVAQELGLDSSTHKMDLACEEYPIGHNIEIKDLPSVRLTVALTKLGLPELLEPEIRGGFTPMSYQAKGVLGQDGCIYFAPYSASKVMRITGAGEVELLEPEIPGSRKYWAGVLAPDGCIYFAPNEARKVLRITRAGGVELLEPDTPIGGQYKAGVLAPDGCVYFAPGGAGKVLRITGAGGVELLEPTIPGGTKYTAGGVLAPDGCVYFAPHDANKVLRIT